MQYSIKYYLITLLLFATPVMAIDKQDKKLFTEMAQEASVCTTYYLMHSKAYKKRNMSEKAKEFENHSKSLYEYTLALVLTYTNKNKANEKVKLLLRESVEIIKNQVDTPIYKSYSNKCLDMSEDSEAYSETFIKNHYSKNKK